MKVCGAAAGLLLPLAAAGVLGWALLQHSSAGAWQAADDPGAGAATACGIRRFSGDKGAVAGAWDRWQQSRSNRTSGAYVVLVGPGERQQLGLELMLRSLHVNVLAAHPRPVLLFYANDVPPEEYTLDVLCRLSPPPIRHLLEVHTIEWALPEHMRFVALHDILALKQYPGYQLMCRWNFVQLVRHPRVRQLDYYCRLDTDSRINSTLEVDLFDHMAANGLHFAYAVSAAERIEWAQGMWDFAADWLHTHMSKPAQALAQANGFWTVWERGHNDSFGIVWNEFEVVHVPRFLEPDILDFVDAVDMTHHIFDRRWGDAPLRTVQMALFLNISAEVEEMRWFSYMHDKGNRWAAPGASPPAAIETR